MSNQKTIILVANPGTTSTSVTKADASPLEALLARRQTRLRPLFGETEERLIDADPNELESLARFFALEVDEQEADAVVRELIELPEVAGAYIQPEPVLAELGFEEVINAITPTAEAAPAATPDFSARQLYRVAAPGGIDVAAAWRLAGGRGNGVGIIDCEGAWRFTHEDLRQSQGGVMGTQDDRLSWRNHGSAVVGVIGGDDNGQGVLGIAPDAIVRGASIVGRGIHAAIRAAADALRSGDIILIEIQYLHATRGYTPVEWWPAEYEAIRYATNRNIIVVEGAGNGGNDLDNAEYDVPEPGFPPDWRNPFRRTLRDCGAVLVGAGAPPPGTHGRDHGPDRSRLGYSNYGSPIDAQGWGREVTTVAYGDLQGGADEDRWYTDLFAGTSSAAPIVVGALACVQGALRAAGLPQLTPTTARASLRATGSAQQDAPGRPAAQRIGNRPNVGQMLERELGSRVTALYRYWNGSATDHFYTTNRAELGSSQGWAYEGIQCYICLTQAPGTVPLYRYWNRQLADHFYTTDWAELGAGAHGWVYECIQGYAWTFPAPGTVPLHRYWGHTDHFYTTHWSELGGGAQGWVYEGVQCHVSPMGPIRVWTEGEDSATSVPAKRTLSFADKEAMGFEHTTDPTMLMMPLKHTSS